MNRIYFVLAFSLSFLLLRAQQDPCQTSPFECLTRNIESAHNEQARLTNFLNLPQELEMESRCRAAAENALRSLTETRHWSYYEVDEEGYAPTAVDCNDTRSAMSTTAPNYDDHFKCGVKYPFRPPHGYSIKFAVVVNEDSLAMWRNWRKDTLAKEEEPIEAEWQNLQLKATNNPRLKALDDSINFYVKKQTEFSSQYGPQYFKDLNADNKKGIEFYQARISLLEKKADFFRNEYQEEFKRLSQRSERATGSILNETALKDSRYIEGSVLLVTFYFNQQVNFSSAGRYNDGNPYQFSMYTSAGGARYSFLLLAKTFPSEPDMGHYILEHPSCLGTALFGQWIERGNHPYFYVATYFMHPQDKDISTVKKTPCDVVQTMEVVVQGRKDHVSTFLHEINAAQVFTSLHQ